jgi:hypothetical protein
LHQQQQVIEQNFQHRTFALFGKNDSTVTKQYRRKIEVYIFVRQDGTGFDVNTYGWVKQQGRRLNRGGTRTPFYVEMELAGNAKNLSEERKNGLKVINNLWTKLEAMTNK